MYGNVNSTNALRMLNTLYQANQPPPAPPAPVRAARPAKAKAPRVRPPTPSSSESESDSEYSDSEVSQSSYEDTDVIYKKVVEEAKCPHVSPAGLKDKKSSKDAVAYLKSKNCPEVPKLKKAKTAAPKIEEPVKIEIPKVEMEAPKTKRVVKKKATHTMPDGSVMAGASHSAPAPAAPAPAAAPATASKAGKAKRAPTEYNKFVSAQMKAGKTMKEAAAAYKAQKGSA
jgi:hypothetical protein